MRGKTTHAREVRDWRGPVGTRTALGFIPDIYRRYTAREVRLLNDANPAWWPRYECVGGRLLVTPAPISPHQAVIGNLYHALRLYLGGRGVGAAWTAPADISWSRRDTTLQPDVFVSTVADACAAFDTADWSKIGHLLLVAEVLSRGTTKRDRGFKREVYQRQGVPLYWVIDPKARRVEAWTPDATSARVVDRLVWHPEGAAEPFVMELAALFAPPGV